MTVECGGVVKMGATVAPAKPRSLAALGMTILLVGGPSFMISACALRRHRRPHLRQAQGRLLAKNARMGHPHSW
jgi:hypothetical protein